MKIPKRILAWVKLFALMWFSLFIAGIVFMYLWPLLLELEPILDRVLIVVIGVFVLIAYQASVWPGMWRKLRDMIDGR